MIWGRTRNTFSPLHFVIRYKKSIFSPMEKPINIDKDILGGTPVFMGTRVPIKNLFGYLEMAQQLLVSQAHKFF